MNIPTLPAKPVTRMFVYEMTHPTSEQMDGYVFTIQAFDRSEADRLAFRFSHMRGCGFRLKMNGGV
jgi:peptide subunit release factor RF-3